MVAAQPNTVLLKLSADKVLKRDPRVLESALRMLLLRCTHVTMRMLVDYLGTQRIYHTQHKEYALWV